MTHTATTNAEADAALRSFLPVPIDSLDLSALPLDLYIRHSDTEPPTLYRAAGLEFTFEDSTRLREQGVKFLHIAAADQSKYRDAFTERLGRIFSDPAVARAERIRVIRAACSRMIDDVMMFPGRPEMIETVAAVSRNFSHWSAGSPAEFTYLLDMSGHDFYTTTHMVNVGVGCGLLAREVAPSDDVLFSTVVQGGLLHDVGKRNVPEAVLNKEGKLSDAEWELIRKHPAMGFEELKLHKSLPDAVVRMARDHHERLDGKGYPRAVRAAEICHEARLCAVVDVFDALTAARPYRKPIPALDVLKMMSEGRGTQFDPKYLDAWTAFVKRAIADDPDRALPASQSGIALRLSDLIPAADGAAIRAGQARAAADAANRRRDQRFVCNLQASAAFVTQGKQSPFLIGETFPVRVSDLSRAGARLLTNFPLSLNDTLDLELTSKDGEMLKRRIRVARVRGAGKDWQAGVSFISEAAPPEAEAPTPTQAHPAPSSKPHAA